MSTTRRWDLLGAAVHQLCESMAADERANELIWKASREEGASCAEIIRYLEHRGFIFTTEGVREAIRTHEDNNAIQYDLEIHLRNEIERWGWEIP